MNIFCLSDLLNKILRKALLVVFSVVWREVPCAWTLDFIVWKTTPLQQLAPNVGHWSSYGSKLLRVPDLFNKTDPFGYRDFYIVIVWSWLMSSHLRGFLSMWCFGLFGDAYSRGYSRLVCMFMTDKWHKWRCDDCSLKSMQVWKLKWSILGNSCLHILRHSVHLGWEEVVQYWFLETYRGLWSTLHRRFRAPWPVGVSTQRNADLLNW